MSAALIKKFYDAFAAKDGQTMAGCYHPEAVFSDPVFPDLRGGQVGAMWRMLLERSSSAFRVAATSIEEVDGSVSAGWEAWYTFSKTGRPIHNIVTAQFKFRDGLISEHRDRFSFWLWSRQAFGLTGWILGWSPALRAKVRDEAARGLALYMKRHRLG